MPIRTSLSLLPTTALLLCVALPSSAPLAADDYLLMAPSWGSVQAAAVAEAGGTVRWAHRASGLAVASADEPAFLDRVRAGGSFQAAVHDRTLSWVAPAPPTGVTPDDEPLFPLQWNLLAIEAPAAWAAGCTGLGARVAVVDGGLDVDHPDLASAVDRGCSTSFVPGHPYDTDVGSFWHGTFTAGIVAAADNGLGVVGVAPEATLVGVKVLHGGTGTFGQVIAGILYAADPASFGAPGCPGADVINLGLGALFPRSSPGAGEILAALSRAVGFASSRGAVVVAAAGASGLDLGQAKDLVVVPTQSGGTLGVSATGPEGFAYGATDFRTIASYTNFGEDLVDLAGPGGDRRLFPDPLWFRDLVLSTTAGGGYDYSSGTSWAAAAVSGVAALALSGHPGLPGGALRTLLLRTADDEGAPGHDELYGHGFVNAFRACVE